MEQIFDSLRETAARHPGSIALASRGGHMDYGDLFGNIASAAHAAKRNKLEPGQLVVLAGANPDAQLIIALALMGIGCRVGYSRDVTLYDAHDVPVDAVIADAPIPGVKQRVITVGREWFKGFEAIDQALPATVGAPSMIFSSSGSTGRPKLVEANRATLMHWIWNRKSDVYLSEGRRFLSTIGNRNSGGFLDTISVLINGGMVIRPADRRDATIIETIQLFRPDYALMAPSMLVDVLRRLDEKPAAIEKVRWLRTIGAYCAPAVQRAALDRLAQEFISNYGSSETAKIALGYSGDVLKVDGSVGRVVDNLEVATFDENGQRLPPGSEGEIRVKPPEGMLGSYIGKYAGEQQAIKDGWFATGDIGLVDKNRNLIIRGRASNVINFGGTKVSPEVLEEQIRTFSQVREVGVTGVATPEGFDRICAAIVSGTKLTANDVNLHLRRVNARYPVHMVKAVAAVPKTEAGKIDRVALRRLCSEPA